VEDKTVETSVNLRALLRSLLFQDASLFCMFFIMDKKITSLMAATI